MDLYDELPLPDAPEGPCAAERFSPYLLGLAALVFALASLAVYFLATRKYVSKKNAVLLLGPSDAGKTAILSTLVYNRTLPTHTSMQINSSVVAFPASKKVLRIVDVPGHPRIRDQFREDLADAKAVVFVADASNIARNGPAVAEHLHHVLHALTSLPPSQTAPALLILAHKADLIKSGSGVAASVTATAPDQLAVNRVRTVLERELERRRAAQSGGVVVEGLGADANGDGDESAELGGLECSGAGGGFRFADWEGGEVSFVGTSVAAGAAVDGVQEKGALVDGLAGLRDWLEELL